MPQEVRHYLQFHPTHEERLAVAETDGLDDSENEGGCACGG